MSSIAALARKQRDSGRGVPMSLGKAVKDKAREKLSPLNYLFDEHGIINALFPRTRGFKARVRNNRYGGSFSGGETYGGTSRQLVERVGVVVRNTSYLPSMSRDLNIIRQNVVRLVKVLGGTPKTSPDEEYRKAMSTEAGYEEKYSKKSPTRNKEDGKPKEGSGIGFAVMVGALAAGLTKYFTNQEFKTKVDTMLKSFFDVVFNEEAWGWIKDKAATGLKFILDGIGAIWQEHWKEITVGLLAFGAALNPIGTIVGLFSLITKSLQGIFSVLSNIGKDLGLEDTPDVDKDGKKKGGRGKAGKAGKGGWLKNLGKGIGGVAAAGAGAVLTDMAFPDEVADATLEGNKDKLNKEDIFDPIKDEQERLQKSLDDARKTIDEQKAYLKVPSVKNDETQTNAAKFKIKKAEKTIADLESTKAQKVVEGAYAEQQKLKNDPTAIQGNIDRLKARLTDPNTSEAAKAGIQQDIDSLQKNLGAIQSPQQVKNDGIPEDARTILNQIAGAESGKHGYNAMNQGTIGDKVVGSGSSKHVIGKDLTEMTVADVLAKGVKKGSSLEDRKDQGMIFAAGKYQVIPSTLKGLVDKGLISPDAKFDEATQDKIGFELLKQRGYGKKTGAELQNSAAKEWAGVPLATDVIDKNGVLRKAGESYYGGPNKAGKMAFGSPSQIPTTPPAAEKKQEPMIAGTAPLPGNLSGSDSMKQAQNSVLGEGFQALQKARDYAKIPPPPIINNPQNPVAQAPASGSSSGSTEILDIDISKLVLNIA